MSPTPVELLVVEDNPSDLELTLHTLRAHRLVNDVRVARDGVEAIEFIFGAGEPTADTEIAHHPRLILLDLKLPRLDGLEVLQRLKGDPRTRTIPVVVLTSSREDRDIVDAYRLGVNSYIVKPVDFTQFASSVRELGLYWLLLNEPPSGA